ncbi:hypothetical protein BDY19DRAFT_922931 [Irpex rosettiformis]|uniref:Uncharacterized protein n=1 Tax=Irpex rosettiformis TaxID=378272 RepID=A0ACB8UFY8_9APHY|nr:hypothetical protein BDY19DRAFT_922931 [Irpex rosettiformis]
MPLEATPNDKTLVDRSIQTSPALHTNSSDSAVQCIDETRQDLSSVSVALEGLTLSDKELDAASVDEQPADEMRSITTTARFLKRTHLPERRPSSTGPTSTAASTRVVSLPETVSEYSERKNLRKAVKKRFVSMPVKPDKQIADAANVDGSFESEASMENILPDHDRPSRIRVCSNMTDTPHTPSPPSSPDSIIIIGKNSGDDWVWTGSPPKPIPALHGPSSLPYARCPSGAEGTVIEGQENLPRIIWGLEGEESGRHRFEPSHGTANASSVSSAPHTTPKPSFRTAQAKVPPRFNKVTTKSHQEAQPFVGMRTAQFAFPDSLHQPSAFGINSHPTPGDYEYVVPTHGPIDLSLLARPRSAMGLINSVYEDSKFSSNCAYPATDLRLSGNPEDLDVDWQTSSLTLDSIRNSMLSSQSFLYGGLGDYIQPGSSYSVSSLASSRSPIILDPPSQLGYAARTARHSYSPLTSQNTLLHTPVTTHQPSHRMSALEIAQKFRQQQLLHTQASVMLPTPPSSTSPLWSSGFSPYQESLWSPDVRGTSLGPISPSLSQNRLTAPHLSGVPAAHTRGQPTTANTTDRNGRRKSALPIGVDSLSRRIPEHAFSSNAIDLSLLNPICGPTAGERSSAHVLAIADLQASPVAPRPPPNTPLHTQTVKRHNSYVGNISSGALFDPTLPNPRALNVNRQHPRSIPLNRLIQRRLSSVAEEGQPLLEKKQPRLSPSPDPRPPRFASMDEVTPNGGLRVLGPRFTRQATDVNFAGEERVPSTKQYPDQAPTTSKLPAKQVRGQNVLPRGCQHTDGGSTVSGNVEQPQKNKARGRNSRRGRHQSASVASGPERVDGGLTVRS